MTNSAGIAGFAHAQQQGNDYPLNAGAFLPGNVSRNLESVSSQDGYLMVRAGATVPSLRDAGIAGDQ